MKKFWPRLLGWYRRYISPHKGFCCAHAAYYQGPSCSHAVEAILCEEGLWRGWSRIRSRLRDCRTAAVALRKRKPAPKTGTTQNRACDRLHMTADACSSSCDSCFPASCDFTP